MRLQRFKEAKALFRKSVPVARRVIGEDTLLTLEMRRIYALALYEDADATLGDLHAAVATLEELERIARRVLGGAHPIVAAIEYHVQKSRAALLTREAVPK